MHIKIDTESIIMILTELKQLVKSGITVYDALEIMKTTEESKEIKEVLDNIHSKCSDGSSLGEALDSTKLFPSYMCNIISISEQTGNLESALQSLIKYYTRQNRLSNSIKSMITTPIILLITIISIIYIISIQVLPIFDEMFHLASIQMGGIAYAFLIFGEKLVEFRYGLIYAGIVLLVIAILIKINPLVREKSAYLVNKIFSYTKTYKIMTLSKFAYSMSLVLNSGMNLDEGIDKVKEIIEDKSIVKRLDECKGENILEELYNQGIIDTKDFKLLIIAQQTGSLGEMFDTISDNKEEQYITTINKKINRIEPAVILISSILTGTLLISVLLPLLNVIHYI